MNFRIVLIESCLSHVQFKLSLPSEIVLKKQL